MRVYVLASILLLVLAALPPARELLQPAPEALPAPDVGPRAGMAGARPAALLGPAATPTRGHEAARAGRLVPAPSYVATVRPAFAPREPTRQRLAGRASAGEVSEPHGPRAGGAAVAGAREFTPGSMAHAEAIASIVASQEAASLMEPVARLYFAYFNRTPDYEGFNYYIDERDRGAPIASIADEFAGSLEFEQRYGAVDNASFVDRVHENVFGVPPDPAHRAHWLAQLDSGAMTRGDVMVALSESGAYRAQVGNAVYVAIAFAETLQRAPDAAELAYWERFLEAGNPRRAVIDRLLADTRPK